MTKVHVISVSHSISPMEIRSGVMFRKRPLRTNTGMLFHTGHHISRFWMKNKFIPLDVVFLNRNMRIMGYVTNTRPHSLSPITIGRPSYYVLEMNAGWIERNNAKVGDLISLSE